MNPTSIISGAAAAGLNWRALSRALFLPLAVVLSSAPLSGAEEASIGPSARMAADPASGSLAVELFRTARKPPTTSPVTRAQGEGTARPSLRRVIGSVPANACERLAAVHTLGRALSSEEIALLYQFLKTPPNSRDGNLPDLPAIKNDVLNVLRCQSSPPKGFTDTLLAIYRDPAQDSVIRDYAVQHLVGWYQQGAPDTTNAPNRIRAALLEAAGQNGSTAGTALLGLHLLSVDDPAFCQQDINRLALRLVTCAEAEVAARITAIQVCAERGLKEALPAIQSLAGAQSCVPLRLSATAALARLGAGQQAGVPGRVGSGDNRAASACLLVACWQRDQKEPPLN